MRTTATMLLALLGPLIWARVLWAGSASCEVTISVYIAPQAEWALPEPPRVAPGLDMDVTRTLARSTASATQPGANTGEMIIDNSHTRVADASGPNLVGGSQTKATQVWPGGDVGETRAFINETIMTLSWL